MKYKRILLKLSGESLQGGQKYGLSPETLQSYAEQIKAAAATGVQIGIVIGGGNIFRGLTGAKKGFDRVKGDQMGMLATIINSLALQSALEDNGVRCKVLTSIRMEPIGEYYSKARAIEYLEAGYVVIVGGGTSNPYFTTDSASALRGIEIEADVMLKGTRVDGVYTADPEKDPAATKFDEITFEEVLDRRLKVMDLTAFTLCRENGLRIIVFDMDTAPDFTVEMVDGSSVTLGDLKGKVVLLNFWATWCPPCRQELTRVQTDIIDRFAGKEFVFLPVSRGEKREAVEAFREKTGYAFPMGLDPARTVYDRYASNYIPRNFVIDRKGKVVLTTVGYDEHEFEELIRTIEKTLGN